MKDMRKKGSTAVEMILWYTALLAALIVLVWFVRNNPFRQLSVVDKMDEDLLQLSDMVSHACVTQDYYGEYNPLTESGAVVFSGQDVCLELDKSSTRRCAPAACPTNLSSTIDLGTLTFVTIRKTHQGVFSVGSS